MGVLPLPTYADGEEDNDTGVDGGELEC